MPKFRKKPVVIDAFQLPPSGDDHLYAFFEWCAEVGFDDYASERDESLAIHTLEGTMIAQPGDWIIKGVKGEFYPCKPDIFEVTYESAETNSEPITEEWLKDVGFKWHELARQGRKHWTLWLGDAVRGRNSITDIEDLGVEVAPAAMDGAWFCWFRSDLSGKYSRFIHLRYLKTQRDLIWLIEGITGQKWDPANNLYGAMRKPEDAQRIRANDERLDRKILKERPWRDIEKDESRGGALPEHLEAYEKLDLKNNRDL